MTSMNGVLVVGATSLIALGAEAIAQEQETVGRRNAYVVNNWAMNTSVSYTDNYARINDGPYERRFFRPVTLPNDAVVTIEDPTLGSDTVNIDPVSNTFVSLGFQGSSVALRPRFEGIVSGSISIGQYLEDTDFTKAYDDQANANIPADLTNQGIFGSIGSRNFQNTFVDPNLSGLGSFELIEDRVFVEVGGFLQEQAVIAGNELTAQAPGQDNNEATLAGVFISPVYLARFAEEQQVEVRYRNSSVFVVNETVDETTFGRGQTVNDSISNEALVSYATGNLLDRLELRVLGSYRYFDEQNSDLLPSQTLEQISGSAGLYYELSRTLTLNGNVGYDEIDNEFTSAEGDDIPPEELERLEGSQLSGVYYSLGFTYIPNQRLQLSFNAGERFAGVQINGSLNYQVTPRLTVTGDVERVLSSSVQDQQSINQQINSRTLNIFEQNVSSSGSRTGNTVESRVGGLGGGGAGGGAGFAGASGRAGTRASVGITGIYGRNVLSFAGQTRWNDNGNDGRDASGNQYRLSGRYSRRLSRRMSINASGIYMSTDRGNRAGIASQIQEFQLSSGLNYTFSRNASIFADYTRLQRQGEPSAAVSSLFGGTLLEYEENRVRFGAQWSF
ncbi:MAG: hypothetical protein AAF788_00695 [Pseudomonadota bacterium]